MTKPLEDYHFVSQLHNYEGNEELEAKIKEDDLAFLKENRKKSKGTNSLQRRKRKRGKFKNRIKETRGLQKNGRYGKYRCCRMRVDEAGKEYMIRYYKPKTFSFFKNQANRKIRRTSVYEDIPKQYKKCYSIIDEIE